MEYDHEPQETGVDTGDARENDPRAPGFTDEPDRLFRSQFQHANRLADRSYEETGAEYHPGVEPARIQEQRFEEVERDLEQGWLNVRTQIGDWAAVRDYTRAGSERGRVLGVLADAVPTGGEDTEAGRLEPFADPAGPSA